MNTRLRKLVKKLKDDTTSMLILSNINRTYFSNFISSAGALLITKNQTYLLVDFRYGESAKKKAFKECKVIVYENFYEELKNILKKHNVKVLKIESKTTTISTYNNLKTNLKDMKISINSEKELDIEIEKIRIIKSNNELKNMQMAQQIAEKAYLEILNYIKPEVEEKKLALELEYLMKKNGAEKTAFNLITITGNNTSLPHGVPSNTKIKSGDFVLFDIGAVYNGYHSDMTRTVGVNYLSDNKKNVYNIVLSAQKKALSKIKSNIVASKIDKVARDIIDKAGYGDFFGHSTGHGVGMNIHEAPTISSNSNTVLKENMVFTVEPGIYLPNEFGVRIEDMVAVTKESYHNFTNINKELIIL